MKRLRLNREDDLPRVRFTAPFCILYTDALGKRCLDPLGEMRPIAGRGRLTRLFLFAEDEESEARRAFDRIASDEVRVRGRAYFVNLNNSVLRG